MDQNAVFYHIGGVMMEDEKKRRCWENDPPGWYFWSSVRAGDRRLHGPYVSREQADEEVGSFHEEEGYAQPVGAAPRPVAQRNVIVGRIASFFQRPVR